MAAGYVLKRAARAWRSAAGLTALSSKKENANPLTSALAMRQHSKYRGKSQPPSKAKRVQLVNTGEYPYVISKEMENIITAGDPQAKLKLKAVLMMLSIKRECGEELPEILDCQQFLDMVECTEDQVHKLIKVFCIQNKNGTSGKIKACKNVTQHQMAFESDNSLFLPFSKADQFHYYNTNLINGLVFGQQIVIDCDFDEYMTLMEIETTAKHVSECIHQNRKNSRPFGLNFCNVKSNGRLLRHLKLHHLSIGDEIPIKLHTCSYLDLFRREDIVYLSPHVHREFEYHPNDVYVLSAKSNDAPLCVKKARNEGVRCFKLPLEFHEMRRKSHLRINEAFKKLLLRKNTGACHKTKTLKK